MNVAQHSWKNLKGNGILKRPLVFLRLYGDISTTHM